MAIAIETLTDEQILVVRESLGLATTDSPTFAGATFSGTVNANNIVSSGDMIFNAPTGTDVIFQNNGSDNFRVKSGTQGIYLSHNASAISWVNDLSLRRDAANTLAQRNGTNGQKSRLYKTYTSATSGEWLELDAATDASNFDLAACIGSAGGTARGIRIGGKNAAGTFNPAISLTFSNSTFSVKSLGAYGVQFATHGGTVVSLLGVSASGYGSNFFTVDNLAKVAIDVRGFVGQTAPLLQFQNSSGISHFKAYDTGALEAATAIFSGQSLTGSQATSALSIATTWNTTGAPTALSVDVTDTASPNGSQLLKIQVGGANRLNLIKNTNLTNSYYLDIANGAKIWNRSGQVGLMGGGGAANNGVEVAYFLGFSTAGGTTFNAADTYLFRDNAANIIGQRNNTNGQKSRIYKTYTSATSGEWLEFDAATDASNFDIAASIGSAGGTARGIRIGGKDAAGTFTPWMSFATSAAATFSLPNGSEIQGVWSNVAKWRQDESKMFPATNGGYNLGTTALRWGTVFTQTLNASGDLQIGNAAVAETPVATHTLVIKDSTGTSYRVLAVAV